MTQPTSRALMPGAFNFEHHQDHGSAPRLSGAKSHIFQPPRTPSASSSLYLTRSTTSILSDSDRSTTTGRKRTRTDYNAETNATPVSMMVDWSTIDSVEPGSPMPFVNTRYRLAGGMDTPTGDATAAHELDVSEYSDIEYRRGLSGGGVKRIFVEEKQSCFPQPQVGLSADSNGRPRVPSFRPSNSEGWSKTALEVVGGVVGKVWEFCKTSAFRGFQAGGGKGYINSSTSTPQVDNRFYRQESEKMATFGFGDRESTPLPGQFPDEDFIPDYMDRATPEATPPRPAKRRQVSSNQDEITRNWVVVPPKVETPSKPPVRGSPRYSIPTASSASRRGTVARPASKASGVGIGARRPILASSKVSHAGPPGSQSNHGASYASPRSPASKDRDIPMSGVRATPRIGGGDSPAAIEAQKWAAKKRKEEREADESIRRFNAQLKAMIKEGKEALGTKVEVEGDDELNGYESKKWTF
jgi:hypothetical protein